MIKQGNSRKTSTSASLTILKPLTVWITTNRGKFLKSWNTRTPYLPPEKSVRRSRSNSQNWSGLGFVRTGHGTTDWFQIGKGACQSCILPPCLFNLYTEYIMQNAKLDETQTGIKIAGRNVNNLRWYAGGMQVYPVRCLWGIFTSSSKDISNNFCLLSLHYIYT